MHAALDGLINVLRPESLALMTLGVVIGSTVGFIPGIGGLTALAIMLPFVMTMTNPYAVIALLVGLEAVGNTANAFPAILISVPGSVGAQATILDGYPLAKKGEAARALSASFIASLLGGFIGAVVLLVSLPVFRPMVLAFGSPEFFVLTVWGVTMVAVLSGNTPAKGLAAGMLGLLIATIGVDEKSGIGRFDFDSPYLWTGVNLIIVALGMFGLPEIIALATQKSSIAEGEELGAGFKEGIWDVFRHWWLMLRCAAIGAWVGFLPGLGSSVADWFAYAHAVQTERNRDNFGKGDIRGVIAPESANNAKAGGSYIPTLAFGIPGSTSTALILTAFVAVGIHPGPDMLSSQLNLTFAVIWTLVLANVIAVVLCMALVKPLAKACFLPFYTIVPVIAVFVFIGAFAANYSGYDLITLLVLSLLGFMMKRHGWPRPPLILGVVLGKKMETYLWLSYARYGMRWLERPAVLILLLFVIVSLVYPMFREHRGMRRQKGAVA